MPPATLVRWALPPILATMTSCLGPQAFFHKPIISIGTGSGSVPAKTVQAVPVIPGFSSEDFMIWTGPVLGGVGLEFPATTGTAKAANARDIAAIRFGILISGTPKFHC